MPKSNQYQSVRELIRDRAEPEQAASFEHRLARRDFVKHLTVMRMRKGLTQAEVGEQLKCKQSKISKLESGFDDDLTLGELRDYLRAIDHDFMIVVAKKQWTIVEQIKWHTGCIRQGLQKLVDLSSDDTGMLEAVKSFNKQLLYNVGLAAGEAFANIRSALLTAKDLQVEGRVALPQFVDVDDEDGECQVADSATRALQPSIA